MRGLRGVFVVFGLVCALSLAGCGLPWPFPQPTPDPKLPDAQQVFRPLDSGTNAGDMDSLDPGQLQFQFDSGMAQLIFPQLVTLDEQQPVDWAAESHEISADGLTYTFHLHKGMTWADGTPIDATTFAYSINRTLDPCTESGVAYYLYDLAGAEAFNNSVCPANAIKSTATLIGTAIQTPDPLTLRLTLAHPAGYFLAELTWPTSYAVPQALVEKYTTPVRSSYNGSNGTDSTWTKHLLDNGPFGGNLFLLTNWQHPNSTADGRGHLVFERNERFWGKKPLLRRIEYTLYKDSRTQWQDFILGDGDSVRPFLDPNSSDAIAQARTLHGVVLQQVPSLSFQYFAINWNYAPFDDARVRQAFSLALDRQAIAREVYLDASQPTIHLAPEGMPGYNPDLTDAAGRKGKDALTPDIPGAQALLKSYVADKCRGRLVLCPPVVLSVPNGSARLVQLGKMLQQQWQQAFTGWSISLQTLGGDAELSRPRRLQLWWDGWGADYPDPQDFLSILWATQAKYNYSAVSMPQVDALLAQADGMSDQTARIALYQQAEQLLINQGAAIPLTQSVNWYAVRSRVVGWHVAPMGVTPLSVWQQVYIKR
jgi:oligopeptide transport system substrate-binding protein